MASISEDIQCAGSDTRPPMLDRETLADGALGPERDRVFKDLTPEEKDRYKVDIRATNIILQGLPKDIYTLINHYTDAKDIWDNVKMLLEGSELTKDECESQLYDAFEHFRQNKEETIHEYYVRFTKLINDMRNIKMTMPKMQLNSKFLNNMLPEWGRFVTTVKPNRGLKSSNYDQLYAYLKQHEAHANENKMMLERFTHHATDPLAFVSNVSPQQYPSQSSAIPQSAYVPPATVQNGRVVVQNVQGRQNRVQGNNARGAIAAGNREQCTHPKRPQNSKYFKDKMLLMQARENGVVLDEEQLLFIAGGQTNTFDADVDEAPVQDLALNEDHVFEADQCDAFDSNVDEAPTAQTMFMANLSSADPIYDEAGPSYDSDIISEVQDHGNCLDSAGVYHELHEMQNDVQQNYVVHSNAEYTSDSNLIPYEQYVENNAEQVVQCNVSSVPNDAIMMIINDMHEQAAQCISANEQNKVVNESLTAELTRYKKLVGIYEKGARFELTEREPKIDEQLRIIITDRNIQETSLKTELHSVKMQLNSAIDHNKLMKEEVATLKKDFKQKENKYLEDFLDMKALKEKSALYNGHEIVKTNHAPAVVHDSEDTLELAEITRKRMLEKVKSHMCVEKRAFNRGQRLSRLINVMLLTYDVEELLTAQSMFMVQDHDNYIDSVGEYHEVHEMQNDVQPNYVVDSDAEYTSDSNIIPYEQYVKDNAVQVVQSNVSSVPNDALMMIINDMHEQAAQCVSANEQNKVVNESLTAELARYKEQVELYEKRARFELTKREQKIDEQIRIIIRDRNVQEELLKKELHSVKMQLNSTINHNKLIKEEVTTLKKDFKQKENKYLEEFLDMKQLKEKVEDKLYKQDQSLQTVHMLCKPKPFYDEKKKVAIGYKNPLNLTKAKQVQPVSIMVMN
ncbi:hypothetical protein Tco_0667236 [Tanacetum coccineum]